MNFLKKFILSIIFCVYLAILTKLVLFKYIPLSEMIHHFNFRNEEYFWRSNNFVPFKTIHFYLFLADVNLDIKIKNLAGNVIGFIPFGFILPLLAKKFQSFGLVTAATFILSLTFEVLQLLFKFGSFDVDDLILNTLGGILGYIPFKLALFIWHLKKNKTTVIN
ncbi:VanZ family protein [Neobacillus sp. Marseille-QA0830]